MPISMHRIVGESSGYLEEYIYSLLLGSDFCIPGYFVRTGACDLRKGDGTNLG